MGGEVGGRWGRNWRETGEKLGRIDQSRVRSGQEKLREKLCEILGEIRRDIGVFWGRRRREKLGEILGIVWG